MIWKLREIHQFHRRLLHILSSLLTLPFCCEFSSFFSSFSPEFFTFLPRKITSFLLLYRSLGFKSPGAIKSSMSSISSQAVGIVDVFQCFQCLLSRNNVVRATKNLLSNSKNALIYFVVYVDLNLKFPLHQTQRCATWKSSISSKKFSSIIIKYQILFSFSSFTGLLRFVAADTP
jgi:hypothetical protein